MLIITIQRSNISKVDFWQKLSKIDENDIIEQKNVYEKFYWLNAGIECFFVSK